MWETGYIHIYVCLHMHAITISNEETTHLKGMGRSFLEDLEREKDRVNVIKSQELLKCVVLFNPSKLQNSLMIPVSSKKLGTRLCNIRVKLI